MKLSRIAPLVLVLSATGALAQTTTTTPTDPAARTAPAARPANVAPTQEVKGAWNVKDFFQTNVYNMAGEKIGDVNDIVVDESGKVTAIVIGVGGFLGIGEKEVSMKTDEVKRMVHSNGKTYFTVNATADQLKAAPAYARPKQT
jgi:sporulation protein YlmC with PRC-barrel domain